jgi:hypothetical protein
MTTAALCAQLWAAHKGDCAGFARAVAAASGIPFASNPDANAIADLLRNQDDGWVSVADGAAAAAACAGAQALVLGALRGDALAKKQMHGHVVVVVPGPLDRGKYPQAWWGSLGGPTGRGLTIAQAWTPQDRDKVVYASHAAPLLMAPGAGA